MTYSTKCCKIKITEPTEKKLDAALKLHKQGDSHKGKKAKMKAKKKIESNAYTSSPYKPNKRRKIYKGVGPIWKKS